MDQYLIPFVSILLIPLFSRFLGLDLDKRLDEEREALAVEVNALKGLMELKETSNRIGLDVDISIPSSKLQNEIPKAIDRYIRRKNIILQDFSRMSVWGMGQKDISGWRNQTGYMILKVFYYSFYATSIGSISLPLLSLIYIIFNIIIEGFQDVNQEAIVVFAAGFGIAFASSIFTAITRGMVVHICKIRQFNRWN